MSASTSTPAASSPAAGTAATPDSPTVPMAAPGSPPAGPATVAKRSRSAVARSAAGDRWSIVAVGVVLVALGTLVALLSYGVFGTARAGFPVLDPVVLATLDSQLLISRLAAIAIGLLLIILGLIWAARALRPERRPDLVLDARPGNAVVVSSSAAAEAIAAQAGALPGVGRASARMVGSESAPALRMTLWLTEDAEVAEVLRLLDDTVLADTRSLLGLTALPAAVRLELDTPTGSRPKVA